MSQIFFYFFFFLIFVKMADNLGPMAWLLLPENEQVQYLLKIALRAENPYGLKCYLLWTNIYFLL